MVVKKMFFVLATVLLQKITMTFIWKDWCNFCGMNSDGDRNASMERQAFNSYSLFTKKLLSCCCGLGFVLGLVVGLVCFFSFFMLQP